MELPSFIISAMYADIFYILVCLKDSVLAFHEHGMQGKSFKQNKVTQEILDGQRTYNLVGADRYEPSSYITVFTCP